MVPFLRRIFFIDSKLEGTKKKNANQSFQNISYIQFKIAFC